MKIRHHFPRPLGRRHPAWWMVVALALVVALVVGAIGLVYLRPTVLVYGLAAVSGQGVEIRNEHDKEGGRLTRAVTFPVAAGHNLTGKYQNLRWRNTHELEITGVTVGNRTGDSFFYADAIRLGWNWRYVFKNRRLSNIDLDAPNLYLGKMLAAFPQAGEEQADPSESGEKGVGDPIAALRRVFYKFTVSEGVLWLDNLAPGMPTLPLTIGHGSPVVWVTGPPDQAAPEEENVKFAEMNGIVLYAPSSEYDNARVLDLGKVRIGFKWEGLARQEIESLSINSPTIYVGPPLFDFASAFKQAGAGTKGEPVATATKIDAPLTAPAPQAAPSTAAPSAKSPWIIKNLALSGGHIEITAFGAPGLMLPFTFAMSAMDVDLTRLDQLSLQNAIKIARQDLDYPNYGVKLSQLEGQIYFSLPPGAKSANNLVDKITVKEARWKELALTDVWSSVTTDRTGIYGKVGGAAYKGYVNGDYWVRFDDGFPWHAGLYITNAGIREPVEKLAGKSFSLDGKMSGSLEVDAKSREILRTAAKIWFPQGGRMEIPSVDSVAQKLPADWAPWKAQIVDSVLSGFRDYRFDTGTLSASYGVPTSRAQLTLEGSQGRRNFELNWTRENAQDNFTLPQKTPPRITIQAQPAAKP